MAEKTLYWHDYETFGVDPRRDYPVQFAGLRTDAELNLLGDPLVLYCQPPLDRLPAPEACLVTGITPQLAKAQGVREAAFIAAIHEELARPDTCGVGYNTLRFDDEVTRNALYRNFYDPYEREWRNGNSRWDIIDMVRLTAALRPEGIEWPLDQQGRPSFRLELLTQVNGIGHSGAHDALADVRATIDLARLVRKRQPRLYDFIWRNRGKHEAAELLALGSFEPVLHVSEKYPAERACIAVVMALARHPTNQNEVAVFDLSFDPSPLLELDAEGIRQRLFSRAADLPDGVQRIPLKTVHLNKCPVLVPMATLRPIDAERLAIDLGVCRKHLAVLRQYDLTDKLQTVFTRDVAREEPQDPDLMIYSGGFFSNADKGKMAKIRTLDPARLTAARPQFDDPRLAEMLFRYRARNWPENLDEEEARRWQAFRQASLMEPLAAYEARLADLESRPQTTARDLEILSQLREWSGELADFS